MPNIEDAWQNQGDSAVPMLASVLRQRAKDAELSLRLQYCLGLVVMGGAIWAFLFHYIHTRDFWLATGTLMALGGGVAFLIAAPWLDPAGPLSGSRRLQYWLGLGLLAVVVWESLLVLIRTFHFWMGAGVIMGAIGVGTFVITVPGRGPLAPPSPDLGLTTSAEFYRQRLRNRGSWLSRFIRTAIWSMLPGYLVMACASIGVSRGALQWLHLAPFLALLTIGLGVYTAVWLRERKFVRREIDLVEAIIGPGEKEPR